MTNPANIQTPLLAWFAAHARDLPWRRTRDPYRILVSEIMLQQTQVERVVPKYHAFLEAFPTLDALADAPTAEVIRLWAGLGYNRRAVNLQRAARAVRDSCGGQFPRTAAGLQALPGIGPYTAGAVACFAFEQDVAFMDTNIRRVLRRALVGPDQIAPPPGDRALLDLGAALIPPGQGWAWNQAIMELGALICTAAAPACRRCPISGACRAHAAQRAEDEASILAMGDARELGAPPRPARRVAERREEPFKGSRRWHRGRIIDALRAHPALPLSRLGPLVKPDYSEADADWLRELVGGLARDGLAILEGDEARLP
ncbi:A/G-specific adenine glycosylase [Oscillochloris sp. ZM17-4]|uniref:A/G-specific adenine glycosylase n=1 Tax=Oscillochloris sp. ZM17-4 TaxID=2866714 RepID=UPI00272DFEAF|nr:A/G-specific adenine glycosylase [Oscillochloris sp. ZM17-4]